MSRYRRPRTLLDAFVSTVAQQPDDTAISSAYATRLPQLTWTEYAAAVATVAGHLVARGIAGRHVVLSMPNCPEFHVADLAVLAAGGTPVSIYHTASSAQIAHVLTDSEAALAIAFPGPHTQRLTAAARAHGTDVAVLEFGPGSSGPDLLTTPATGPVELTNAVGDLSNPATVIYTSGTTGAAKGVMVSQRNVVAAFESTVHIVGLDGRGKRVVSYLPMAHVAERMSSHYNHVLYGSEVVCCPSPDLVYDVVRAARPSIFFGPPRAWEKFVLSVTPQRSQGTALMTALEEAGLGELELAVSGAAPMAPQLFQTLREAGVPIGEVYGLSETTGVMTWDAVEVRAGSVGRALPDIEVRLADDGEVQCRGPVVFDGYLHDPERTAEAFTADGWFRSGDLGELDADGYLRIVGRQKDLLVTAGGKNVAPAPLEAMLTRITGVNQALVIGDDRPFVSALLVPDDAALDDAQTLDSLAGHVATAIATVNSTVSRAEGIRRFTFLHQEWTPESGLLTPTMKLRRSAIVAAFRNEIDDLYSGGGFTVD